ncbi:hypothetical protein G4177_23400 [Corallococcus sp. ZKHCc1 1396]|uniref:Flagellar hook-length control protein FliK n=1 Tax=Corallococcus soli TaxID=2710757 RepID=A0ABR9PT69_9BACT|nr:hypothetical protein [Corallococcus soli]MBE4751125.1 hypothetical protein [Corallococcus soli]
MRLWIAIVAGLSLGQSQDVEPLPPEDPSVRDPSAAALQDAYEQAAEDADGARPPQGYGLQGPTDPSQGAYPLTPLLPDGSPPINAGEVATEQSRTYVAPPVPTIYESRPDTGEPSDTEAPLQEAPSGTGGSGAAGTASTEGGTTAGQDTVGAGAAGTSPTSGPTNVGEAGFGGTVDTGAAPASPASQAPTGGTGEVPLDSSQVTVQEPGTGGAGASGTTDTGTSSTPPPATSTGAPAQAPADNTSSAAPAPNQAGASATAPSVQGAPEQTGSASATPVQAAPDLVGSAATTPVQGTQAAAGTAASGAPNAANPNEEVNRLRERIAQLEQEMEERDALATERTQSVQSQVDAHEQRAYESERSRQQRLARIQSAGQWMLAADQALEQGELGVDNALSIADQDFSVVGANASAEGQGMVVVHSQRARAQIALARDAAGRRDVYAARIALQTAGEELRLMRAASLDRPGSSNVLLNR